MITNTRGDVIETRNGDGNVNAKFTYDAWGKLVSVTDANGNALSQDSFAYQISLKYRGYVYDVETGLYYLQSRYYDPNTGRFINADDVEYIGYSGEVISYNIFAYCENEPIYRVDHEGYYSKVFTLKFKQLIVAVSTIYLLAIALEITAKSAGLTSYNTYLLAAVGVIGGISIAALITKYVQDKTYYDNMIFIVNASTAATPPPPNKGEKGTQVTSKTLYTNKKKGYRIDVENPGNRQGQIHLQIDGKKYIYNVKDNAFHLNKSNGPLAPNSIQNLLNERKVINAIVKGLKILGY